MDSKFRTGLQKLSMGSSTTKILEEYEKDATRIKDLPLNDNPHKNSFLVIDSEEEGVSKISLPRINGILINKDTTLEDLGIPSSKDVHSIPSGGSKNQVLKKISDKDYEAEWTDIDATNVASLSEEDIVDIYQSKI